MRILIIRSYPSYVEVENNTYNIQEVGLAKALVRKGNVCDIVFWTKKQEKIVRIPVDEYGEIVVFYKHGKTFFKNTIYTGCEELFERYDILQSSEYNQIQSWILSKSQLNKTVVYHGPYYSPFNKRYNLMCKVFDFLFLKRYLIQGTQFLAKSEMAKEFLVNKGIKEQNISVVGVGIDVQMLSCSSEKCKELLYQKMERDRSDFKILYIGHFEKRRNLFFIISIFKKVLEQNNRARLYMIGTGNKRYLRALFEYIKQNGIEDKVFWQEKMEQKYLADIYKWADFFLLPTEYEIFGMVLLEAMFYETVVLTTKNGGSCTLIESGKNGFILDEKNASIWAKQILQIYEDKARMKLIQRNASKMITENYIWDILANKFIEKYQSRIKSTEIN